MDLPAATDLEKIDIAARRTEWLIRQRADAMIAAEAAEGAGQHDRAAHYRQQVRNLAARLEKEATPDAVSAGDE